jgi:hypothetical protein
VTWASDSETILQSVSPQHSFFVMGSTAFPSIQKLCAVASDQQNIESAADIPTTRDNPVNILNLKTRTSEFRIP